jgi:Uma2 family endonuclease
MRITQADIAANIPALQQAIRALTRYQREELAEWILNSGDFGDEISEVEARLGGPLHPLTVEEFLVIESGGSARHEFIGGEMFELRTPMPRHQVIVGNLLNLLRNQLRGSPSTLVTSELGLRLTIEQTDFFYRPDVVIARGPFTPATLDVPYLTDPRVIVEVFSPITEDIDRREKVLNYRRVAALEEYLLIAQRSPQVIAFRRSEDWRPVELTALDAVVESPSMDMRMTLREIYAGTSLR